MPGDPSEVFGLTATPQFGGIEVAWNFPTVNPFAVAFTRVFRGITPDFNLALQLVDWNGSRYFDRTAPEVQPVEQFYWVQQLSKNGTWGEVIGPASAVARPTIKEFLEYLTGQIDAGHLAQSLKGPIAHIALLDTKLAEEALQRLADNEALQSALAQVQNDLGQARTLLNQEVTQRTEQNSALVQVVDQLAVSVGQNAAAIVQDREVWVSKTDALARDVQTLYSTIDGAEGGITEQAMVRLSAVEATTSTLTEQVSQLEDDTNAALATERTTRASEVAAVAKQVTDLQAKTELDLAAAIRLEQDARADDVQALASQLTQFQATLGSGTNLLQNSSFEFDTDVDGLPDGWTSYSLNAPSGGKQELVDNTAVHGSKALRVSWVASGGTTNHRRGVYQDVPIPADATKVTGSISVAGTSGAQAVLYLTYRDAAGAQLGVQFSHTVNLKGPAVFERISREMGAKPDGAVTARLLVYMQGFSGAAELLLDAAQMQVGVLTPYDLGPDSAVLKSEIQARMAADSTLATSIETAQSTLNGNIASAKTELRTEISAVDGKVTNIGAQWTAQVDVNNLIGGFGVYNDGRRVEAGFDVDRFWVGRTTNKIKPFIIENDEVLINKAVIGLLTADMIDTRGLDIRDPTTGQVVVSYNQPLAAKLVPPEALNANAGRYLATGQNRLPNSDGANADTWQVAYSPNGANFDPGQIGRSRVIGPALGWTTANYIMGGSGLDAWLIRQIGANGGTGDGAYAGGNNYLAADLYFVAVPGQLHSGSAPCVPGERLCFSVYAANHRCEIQQGVEFFDASNARLSVVFSSVYGQSLSKSNSLASMTRHSMIAVVPANAARVRCFVRKFSTWGGQADSYVFLAAPQLELIGENATGPGAYVAGPLNGIGQLGYTGDLNATNDIVLSTSGDCTVFGNTLTKATGAAAWDSQVYSRDSYAGGAFVSAVAGQNNAYVLFGLNSDPTTDSSYASIDAAIYLSADGVIGVFESGNFRGAFGSYVAGDCFAVQFDGSNVRYLKNGAVFCQTYWGTTANLFFDSSFHSVGATLRNVRFGPYGNPSAVQPSNPINASNVSTYIADTALGAQRNILSGTGGLVAGTLQWDTTGTRTSGYGVAMTQKGLLGYNSDGTITFSIDATNGNATFSGTLNAATGTFAGNLSAAGGTFKGKLTADAVDAVDTVNIRNNAVVTMLALDSENTAADLASPPVSMVATGKVLVQWRLDFYGPSTSSTTTNGTMSPMTSTTTASCLVEILRDSTVIYSRRVTGSLQTSMFLVDQLVTAGNYTYTMRTTVTNGTFTDALGTKTAVGVVYSKRLVLLMAQK